MCKTPSVAPVQLLFPQMHHNTLSIIELHKLKWLLGQLCAMLALYAQTGLNFASPVLTWTVFAAVFAVTLRPQLIAQLPANLSKIATPLLILFIGTDLILQPNIADFLPPLLRMLCLLLLLRCLYFRKAREDKQLLVLALIMTILNGVLTLSFTFAIQILLFTPLAMGILFIATLTEPNSLQQLAPEHWKNFRWIPFTSSVLRKLKLKYLLPFCTLFATLIIFTSLFFMLIPRIPMPRGIELFDRATSGTIGFSDEIAFGKVNELKDNDRIALRINPPSQDSLPSSPYLRMVVLDDYFDGTFKLSNSAKEHTLHYRTRELSLPNSRGKDDDTTPWTFFLESGVSRYLPTLGPFASLTLPKPDYLNFNTNLHFFHLNQTSQQLVAYQLHNMQVSTSIPASHAEKIALRQITPFARELTPEGNPAPLDYPFTLLSLTPDPVENAILEDIVYQITAGKQLSAPEFSQKATQWLRTNYIYDTRINDFKPDGKDRVVQWLTQHERGWCEHFTGSFILLARTAGFPARAVTGFNGGSWNTIENYLVVRYQNAHSWAEILDKKSGTWLLVDPANGARREADGQITATGSVLSMESDYRAWLDSLRYLYHRRIVQFDATQQHDLVEGAQIVWKARTEAFKAWLTSKIAGLKAWVSQPMDATRLSTITKNLLLGLALLWFTWRAQQLLINRLRNPDKTSHPVRKRAGRLLRKIQSRPSATHSPELKAITRSLQTLRYGPPELWENPKHVFNRARSIYRNARKAYRQAHNSRTNPS